MSYASLKTLRPFFTNKCGRLLAGGKVYTYEVGTLTPKTTYKDAAGLTENTNPIILDASGEADIYINSDYRFQIFDRDGVLVDDVDSVAPTQRISSAFLIDESGFNQAQINATKEDTLNKGAANGYPSLDANTKVPVAQQYEASTTQKGITQLVDDLITGGVDKALTAEQGKILMASFEALKQTNGYQKLPGGLIIQWGQIAQPDNGGGLAFSWTLPIAFPNAAIQAFGSLGSFVDGTVVPRITVESLGQSIIGGFTVGSAVNRTYRLFAIGY